MDVMALLDKLDAYLSECARVPLVGRLMVEEDEVFAIIDDLRAALPQELEQAKWLLKERDRIIAEARKEAEEILKDAQGQIAALASESSISKEARKQAEELMKKARGVAREINLGAREYADDLMRKVEEVMEEVLDRIRQGRNELLPEKEAAATASPQEPGLEDELFGKDPASLGEGPEDDEDWIQDEPPSRGKKRRGLGKG